jgi:hypothetical protein
MSKVFPINQQQKFVWKRYITEKSVSVIRNMALKTGRLQFTLWDYITNSEMWWIKNHPDQH